MSHKDQLYSWLKANRPDVFSQLDQEGGNDFRALDILNRETGIGVRVLDRVEEGSRRFLEAFKAQSTKPTPSQDTPKGQP